jgi:hypothetical protein
VEVLDSQFAHKGTNLQAAFGAAAAFLGGSLEVF